MTSCAGCLPAPFSSHKHIDLLCQQLHQSEHDEAWLQDFNQEVLTTLTSQNVTVNRQRLPKSRRPVSARYFGGDWGSLSDFMAKENLGGSYDIILSAETIYNVDTQQQLFDCIKQVTVSATPVCASLLPILYSHYCPSILFPFSSMPMH